MPAAPPMQRHIYVKTNAESNEWHTHAKDMNLHIWTFNWHNAQCKACVQFLLFFCAISCLRVSGWEDRHTLALLAQHCLILDILAGPTTAHALRLHYRRWLSSVSLIITDSPKTEVSLLIDGWFNIITNVQCPTLAILSANSNGIALLLHQDPRLSLEIRHLRYQTWVTQEMHSRISFMEVMTRQG